jgi:hypothetical protein
VASASAEVDLPIEFSAGAKNNAPAAWRIDRRDGTPRPIDPKWLGAKPPIRFTALSFPAPAPQERKPLFGSPFLPQASCRRFHKNNFIKNAGQTQLPGYFAHKHSGLGGYMYVGPACDRHPTCGVF